MPWEPLEDADPDSPLALAAWLGLIPECGCPLDDCRCLEPELEEPADG